MRMAAPTSGSGCLWRVFELNDPAYLPVNRLEDGTVHNW
jgi:hypothetical protein